MDAERLAELQSVSTRRTPTLPGIAVATRGPVRGRAALHPRRNSSQTLVLIDGRRINDPSSPNAAFDFGALLDRHIGRVEVLVGPNSIIWGSPAIGGVINVQSLTPTEDLVARAGLEYGYADSVRASANFSGTSGIRCSFMAHSTAPDGISALAGGETEEDVLSKTGRQMAGWKVTPPECRADFRGYYKLRTIEYDPALAQGRGCPAGFAQPPVCRRLARCSIWPTVVCATACPMPAPTSPASAPIWCVQLQQF